METIPKKYIDMAEAVGKLAIEAGLRNFSLSINPGFGSAWRDQIQVTWETGRHGEDERQLRVTSTVNIQHRFDSRAKDATP